MGLMTALQTSNLFSIDGLDFLAVSHTLMYDNNKCNFFKSRQSAVGVQAKLWPGRQEFRIPARARGFSLHQNLQTGPGKHPARIQWAPWPPSGAKAARA